MMELPSGVSGGSDPYTDKDLNKICIFGRYALVARTQKRLLPLLMYCICPGDEKIYYAAWRAIKDIETVAALGSFKMNRHALYAFDELTRQSAMLVRATCLGSEEIRLALIKAMRADTELLLAAAEREKWTDDTPVPPEFFGHLWPFGAPKGWPNGGRRDEGSA